MNRHVATALCFTLTLPLAAQEPTPPRTNDQSRTEERAQSMREQIDGGRTVRSHVRVLVRLKNGNKLRGVVKDGRFVERVDGLRFVDAQAKDRGAGIRLWYTSGARNYVFVPFQDFAEYTVLQRLSAEELGELEQKLQMEEARRNERLAAAARAANGKAQPTPGGDAADAPPAPGQEPAGGRPTGQPTGTNPAGTGETNANSAGPGAEQTEQQRQWFQLLQSYPPKAGWGRARRDEISRRLAVVGAKPSEHEQRFVDQFAEWEKACQHFAVDPETEQDGGAEGGDGQGEDAGNDRRRSRRRRR